MTHDIEHTNRRSSPAPATSLDEAAHSYLGGSIGIGVCASDFLALCDLHGVSLGAATRAHIEINVLHISMRSVATTGQARGVNLQRPMEALTDKLNGIVPTEALRLRVDMIPGPIHGQNLRVLLGKRKWTALREEVLSERENICEICGDRPMSSSKLHAHEVWAYNLKKRPAVALLTRIGLLCPLCHGVEHLGNSMALIREGAHPETYMDTLEAHFIRVNGVSKTMWAKHVVEAFEAWEKVSKRKAWQIDLGQFRRLLDSPPAPP